MPGLALGAMRFLSMVVVGGVSWGSLSLRKTSGRVVVGFG